jgi:hypothetical protein
MLISAPNHKIFTTPARSAQEMFVQLKIQEKLFLEYTPLI